MFKTKPKLDKQFAQIDKDRIPFAILVAPDEVKEGKVRVKQQVGKEEGEGKMGVLMERTEVVDYLRSKLASL